MQPFVAEARPQPRGSWFFGFICVHLRASAANCVSTAAKTAIQPQMHPDGRGSNYGPWRLLIPRALGGGFFFESFTGGLGDDAPVIARLVGEGLALGVVADQ